MKKKPGVRHRKRGRPRIHTNPVWFGMKIAPEERELIRKLAKRSGKSAARAIMDVVKEAVKTTPAKPKKRYTASELFKLPPHKRSKILAPIIESAVADYSPGGDLYIPDSGDILEY